MFNQPYTTLDPNIDQSQVIAAKDKEIAELKEALKKIANAKMEDTCLDEGSFIKYLRLIALLQLEEG